MAAVVDPEIRVITIDELGILRSVDEDPATGRVVVTITPTYTGCPAMDVIRADIRRALAAAGHPDAEVRTVYAPAWSTDWISERGRAKLADAGIAPPAPAARGGGVVPLTLAVRCPRCGSPETEQVSRFGSTACKALWRCRSCSEPFDHLKAL
ncbi:phenylacetate-CoA oxygenase subunit PaaJ [Micromonospora fulviviridis]|nr:phenylacetate-CoA oxygenase subunit PaaJ [Micromonospora fulviviridis]